jgi:hypothetical protein
LETLSLAAVLVSMWYGLQAGGPVAVWRVFRHPGIHWGWKALMIVCLLPWPGPFDAVLVAWILRHLHLTYLVDQEKE